MCWNQPARVDYLRKKWRAAQKQKFKKKGAGQPCPGVDSRAAGDLGRDPAPTAGRRHSGSMHG
jgi:hypothetical protein